MGKGCCVVGCKSQCYSGCNISFHSFPKNEEMKQKWLNNIHVTRKISKYIFVCNRHFELSCFYYANSRRMLKADAVPTISSSPVTPVVTLDSTTTQEQPGLSVTLIKAETESKDENEAERTSDDSNSSTLLEPMDLPSSAVYYQQSPMSDEEITENPESKSFEGKIKRPELFSYYCSKCGHRNEIPRSQSTLATLLQAPPISNDDDINEQKLLFDNAVKYKQEQILLDKNKKIEKHRKKIKILQQRFSRLQKQNKSLKDLLIAVKERKKLIKTKDKK